MAGFAGFGAFHAVFPSFVGRAELPGIMVGLVFLEMTSGKSWSFLVPWIHAHASVYGILPNFTHFLRLHALGFGFHEPFAFGSHLFVLFA